jgi:hypothetical protein
MRHHGIVERNKPVRILIPFGALRIELRPRAGHRKTHDQGNPSVKRDVYHRFGRARLPVGAPMASHSTASLARLTLFLQRRLPQTQATPMNVLAERYHHLPPNTRLPPGLTMVSLQAQLPQPLTRPPLPMASTVTRRFPRCHTRLQSPPPPGQGLPATSEQGKLFSDPARAKLATAQTRRTLSGS